MHVDEHFFFSWQYSGEQPFWKCWNLSPSAMMYTIFLPLSWALCNFMQFAESRSSPYILKLKSMDKESRQAANDP